MRVLVIGSGAREHALCWKLSSSPLVHSVACTPGNPGIAETARIFSVGVEDIEGLVRLARDERIDLTIVGPEQPLALGLVNRFREAGLRIFGPTREAAMLETSKSFAKEVMRAAGIPTAESVTVVDKESARERVRLWGAPVVLKADGLAAGKGVFVCHSSEEAMQAVERLYQEDGKATVVVERFLEGEEVSYIVATDGEQIIPMASSHDYKRIFDGQKGPNTGGMGAVSPSPRLRPAQEQQVLEQVIAPALQEMRRRGTPFTGFLYAGLMLSGGAISVLEFNARFGDPECQAIMRRYRGDFGALLYCLADGKPLDRGFAPVWDRRSSVCIVLAAEGYPGTSRSGDEIRGLEQADALPDCSVFHAGTTRNDKGLLVTKGGRVLSVTGLGTSSEEARGLAYRAIDLISFQGCQFRRDIGL